MKRLERETRPFLPKVAGTELPEALKFFFEVSLHELLNNIVYHDMLDYHGGERAKVFEGEPSLEDLEDLARRTREAAGFSSEVELTIRERKINLTISLN